MKMWEIREDESHSYFDRDYSRERYPRMRGYRDDYECGYEEGYRAAMKEAKSYYESKMK